LSPLEAALSFVRDWPGVEGVVVGAASAEEFKDIVAAFGRGTHFSVDASVTPSLALVDPRRWA